MSDKKNVPTLEEKLADLDRMSAIIRENIIADGGLIFVAITDNPNKEDYKLMGIAYKLDTNLISNFMKGALEAITGKN